MRNLLLIAFLVSAAFQLNAQKADDEKVFVEHTDVPKYRIPGKTYTVRIDAEKDFEAAYKRDHLVQVLFGGKTVKSENPDIILKLEVRNVKTTCTVQNESLSSKEVTYVNKIGGSADFTLIILDKEEYELLKYTGRAEASGDLAFITGHFSTEALAKANCDEELKKYPETAIGTVSRAVVNECNHYLNLNVSEEKEKTKFYMFTGKGRKFNYSDLDTALAQYKRGILIYNDKGLNEICSRLFRQAIDTWIKAAAEYVPNVKETRISDRNIGEIYIDIANTYVWLTEYDKAKEYIQKALNYEDNKSEKDKVLKLINDITQNIASSEKFLKDLPSARKEGKEHLILRLKQTVEIVKKKDQYVDLNQFQKSIQNDTSASDLLKAIFPYLNDSDGSVRNFAIDLVNYTGRESKSLPIRQAVVRILVNEYKGLETRSIGYVGSYLKNFKKEDFNSTARDSLAAKIKRGVNNMYDLFLLAGYVKLTNAIPYIKASCSNPKLNDKAIWGAHLALSRMGDKTETESCLNIVKSKEMGSPVVYYMFPGLVYTRQREAFDYLITVLNSDEKNCMSPNPDNPKQILCGFRVMEFLAPVIKDFPLESYKGINQIKAKDYNVALATARSWFKEHKDNYQIIDDTF